MGGLRSHWSPGLTIGKGKFTIRMLQFFYVKEFNQPFIIQVLLTICSMLGDPMPGILLHYFHLSLLIIIYDYFSFSNYRRSADCS
jgi:hypothetical protein